MQSQQTCLFYEHVTYAFQCENYWAVNQCNGSNSVPTKSRALILRLPGNQGSCKFAYIMCKPPKPQMNLDVGYLSWMYFRENWLSPKQSKKNICYILIAETT